MPDRTTITVSADTFDALDEQRGSVPWDEYLRTLAEESEAGDGVELTDEQYAALVDDVTVAVERRLEQALGDLPGRY
jgi:hypothetical protein